MKFRFLQFVLVILPLWATALPAEDRLQLHTRDGNLILSAMPDQPLAFTENTGEDSKVRRVPWSEIASLQLVEFQLNQQSQRVEELLIQLSDPLYENRERAEKLLSDADQFGPFESLIKNFARSSTNHELNYRLQRVLDRLEDYSGPVVGNFDELTLENGKVLRGDAGQFQLTTRLFGDTVVFDRKNLLLVAAKFEEFPPSRSEPLVIRTYNQPFPNFYNDNEKFVSFETLKSGEPVPISENANEMFVFEGLEFQTEDAGFVGTIWYPFKLCPVEPGKKSICPFDETSRVAKRLWGTTLITFCPPGQPGVSAGVKKFGLFLERIEHSRDVVVEAYNAVGQMVGMVEATDQKCVFAGFESNELITCIRISKNADLPELARRVDQSYAIDCVTYSGLERVATLYDPVPGSADALQVKLGLQGGELIHVSGLTIDDSTLNFESSLLPGRQKCEFADVQSLNYFRSRRFAAGENDYLMVQLNDSSIVKTEIDSWKQPFDFLDTPMTEDQIVAIWSGRNPARMPESADFEAGKPIIVYPGCRIIAQDLELKPGGFFWDKESSEKRIQDVKLYDRDDSQVTMEESEDPDFTPDADQVAFRGASQIPTLWLNQPMTVDSGRGYVFLTDGQYFVLGGKNGFRVVQMGSKNVEIEFGNSKKLYPLTRISSIKLPAR